MKRILVGAMLLVATAASAQTAKDPSAKLRAVLPAKVADHVLATIADARSHSLPAVALEQQALRMTQKGAKPADVEKSVDRSADNMKKAKAALEKAGRKPTSDEIKAGAGVIGHGVDGSQVSELARSAPSGRSLAVPLYVTSHMMDHGVKANDALARVHDRLQQKATDRQLIAEENASANDNRPPTANKEGGLAHRPATAPGIAVRAAAPTTGRPATTPGKRP
ncbi:MAG TPA: hypothetical protein VJ852_04440 [Gemmatimonadaceae bacterium]|nr:hypothetical protein [Gemmatimonadaceae bacterium]